MKKTFWDPNLGQTGKNWARNQVFCQSLRFSSLLFHEILQDDSLEQCPTACRGKTRKKNFEGPNLGQTCQNWVENQFFSIFSSLLHQFLFNLHRMIAWSNVKLLVEVKPAKKWEVQYWVKWAKEHAQNQFFCHFFKFGSLVFVEIAQVDSLEHFLTTSVDKTLESNFWGPKWVQNQGICHFLKVASLFFLDIAQDYSLG